MKFEVEPSRWEFMLNSAGNIPLETAKTTSFMLHDCYVKIQYNISYLKTSGAYQLATLHEFVKRHVLNCKIGLGPRIIILTFPVGAE